MSPFIQFSCELTEYYGTKVSFVYILCFLLILLPQSSQASQSSQKQTCHLHRYVILPNAIIAYETFTMLEILIRYQRKCLATVRHIIFAIQLCLTISCNKITHSGFNSYDITYKSGDARVIRYLSD